MTAPTMLHADPVPTIDAHSLLVFLLQISVLLLLALGLGRLAMRFGMPIIVGELSAGVLFGPSVLHALAPGFSDWLLPPTADQMHLLDAVGQVGVILLVGITGIELKFGLIRRRGATAVRVSLGGLLLPLGLGIGIGYLLPSAIVPDGVDLATFSLFLGVAMCVSAIPVIAKTLIDMKLLHREVGQLMLASGVIDDVAGWFLLSIVSAMATSGLTQGGATRALLSPVAVVVVATLIKRPLVRRILRFANQSPDAAPTIATVVILILLVAAATHALALEPVFGALVCGALIGSSGELDVEKLVPLRTTVLAFLAPIFFATAGLRIDLTALVQPVVLLTAVVVLLAAIAGKFAGAYAGARLSRLGRWEGLALGAGMNSRGVIEVIVAMTGLRLGILDTNTYTIIVLVAIVTSLMAPPILRFAVTRLDREADESLRSRDRDRDRDGGSGASRGR
ncbi:cation:proton antiporter [Nonomuraea angiospora]|uniref:cation:proton antiporter n=1 Tax=Nonomuraea angiospora TaxID=46172 RepID=UPI00343E6E7B